MGGGEEIRKEFKAHENNASTFFHVVQEGGGFGNCADCQPTFGILEVVGTGSDPRSAGDGRVNKERVCVGRKTTKR